MKNCKTIMAMVAAGLACTAITSQAIIITTLPTTGGTATPPPSGITYGAQVGLTLNSGFSVSDPNGGILSGIVSSSVFDGSGAAAAGYFGGYEFVYTLQNTSTDTEPGGVADILEHLVLNGYKGIPIQVAIGGSGIAPTEVSRPNASGIVTWDFTDPNEIPSGSTSDLLIIYTMTTQVGTSVATAQDGTSVAGLPIYAPVPESSTVVAGALMLLPFGIGAIRSLRKDRTA